MESLERYYPKLEKEQKENVKKFIGKHKQLKFDPTKFDVIPFEQQIRQSVFNLEVILKFFETCTVDKNNFSSIEKALHHIVESSKHNKQQDIPLFKFPPQQKKKFLLLSLKMVLLLQGVKKKCNFKYTQDIKIEECLETFEGIFPEDDDTQFTITPLKLSELTRKEFICLLINHIKKTNNLKRPASSFILGCFDLLDSISFEDLWTLPVALIKPLFLQLNSIETLKSKLTTTDLSIVFVTKKLGTFAENNFIFPFLDRLSDQRRYPNFANTIAQLFSALAIMKIDSFDFLELAKVIVAKIPKNALIADALTEDLIFCNLLLKAIKYLLWPAASEFLRAIKGRNLSIKTVVDVSSWFETKNFKDLILFFDKVCYSQKYLEKITKNQEYSLDFLLFCLKNFVKETSLHDIYESLIFNILKIYPNFIHEINDNDIQVFDLIYQRISPKKFSQSCPGVFEEMTEKQHGMWLTILIDRCEQDSVDLNLSNKDVAQGEPSEKSLKVAQITASQFSVCLSEIQGLRLPKRIEFSSKILRVFERIFTLHQSKKITDQQKKAFYQSLKKQGYARLTTKTLSKNLAVYWDLVAHEIIEPNHSGVNEELAKEKYPKNHLPKSFDKFFSQIDPIQQTNEFIKFSKVCPNVDGQLQQRVLTHLETFLKKADMERVAIMVRGDVSLLNHTFQRDSSSQPVLVFEAMLEHYRDLKTMACALELDGDGENSPRLPINLQQFIIVLTKIGLNWIKDNSKNIKSLQPKSKSELELESEIFNLNNKCSALQLELSLRYSLACFQVGCIQNVEDNKEDNNDIYSNPLLAPELLTALFELSQNQYHLRKKLLLIVISNSEQQLQQLSQSLSSKKESSQNLLYYFWGAHFGLWEMKDSKLNDSYSLFLEQLFSDLVEENKKNNGLKKQEDKSQLKYPVVEKSEQTDISATNNSESEASVDLTMTQAQKPYYLKTLTQWLADSSKADHVFLMLDYFPELALEKFEDGICVFQHLIENYTPDIIEKNCSKVFQLSSLSDNFYTILESYIKRCKVFSFEFLNKLTLIFKFKPKECLPEKNLDSIILIEGIALLSSEIFEKSLEFLHQQSFMANLPIAKLSENLQLYWHLFARGYIGGSTVQGQQECHKTLQESVLKTQSSQSNSAEIKLPASSEIDLAECLGLKAFIDDSRVPSTVKSNLVEKDYSLFSDFWLSCASQYIANPLSSLKGAMFFQLSRDSIVTLLRNNPSWLAANTSSSSLSLIPLSKILKFLSVEEFSQIYDLEKFPLNEKFSIFMDIVAENYQNLRAKISSYFLVRLSFFHQICKFKEAEPLSISQRINFIDFLHRIAHDFHSSINTFLTNVQWQPIFTGKEEKLDDYLSVYWRAVAAGIINYNFGAVEKINPQSLYDSYVKALTSEKDIEKVTILINIGLELYQGSLKDTQQPPENPVQDQLKKTEQSVENRLEHFWVEQLGLYFKVESNSKQQSVLKDKLIVIKIMKTNCSLVLSVFQRYPRFLMTAFHELSLDNVCQVLSSVQANSQQKLTILIMAIEKQGNTLTKDNLNFFYQKLKFSDQDQLTIEDEIKLIETFLKHFQFYSEETKKEICSLLGKPEFSITFKKEQNLSSWLFYYWAAVAVGIVTHQASRFVELAAEDVLPSYQELLRKTNKKEEVDRLLDVNLEQFLKKPQNSQTSQQSEKSEQLDENNSLELFWVKEIHQFFDKVEKKELHPYLNYERILTLIKKYPSILTTDVDLRPSLLFKILSFSSPEKIKEIVGDVFPLTSLGIEQRFSVFFIWIQRYIQEKQGSRNANGDLAQKNILGELRGIGEKFETEFSLCIKNENAKNVFVELLQNQITSFSKAESIVKQSLLTLLRKMVPILKFDQIVRLLKKVYETITDDNDKKRIYAILVSGFSSDDFAKLYKTCSLSNSDSSKAEVQQPEVIPDIFWDIYGCGLIKLSGKSVLGQQKDYQEKQKHYQQELLQSFQDIILNAKKNRDPQPVRDFLAYCPIDSWQTLKKLLQNYFSFINQEQQRDFFSWGDNDRTLALFFFCYYLDGATEGMSDNLMITCLTKIENSYRFPQNSVNFHSQNQEAVLKQEQKQEYSTDHFLNSLLADLKSQLSGDKSQSLSDRVLASMKKMVIRIVYYLLQGATSVTTILALIQTLKTNDNICQLFSLPRSEGVSFFKPSAKSPEYEAYLKLLEYAKCRLIDLKSISSDDSKKEELEEFLKTQRTHLVFRTDSWRIYSEKDSHKKQVFVEQKTQNCEDYFIKLSSSNS